VPFVDGHLFAGLVEPERLRRERLDRHDEAVELGENSPLRGGANLFVDRRAASSLPPRSRDELQSASVSRVSIPFDALQIGQVGCERPAFGVHVVVLPVDTPASDSCSRASRSPSSG